MDGCPRKSYPTDLSDEQWALAEPLILVFEDRTRPGPERSVDLREVTNTLLYQNRTGCQWAFLPHDLLPKSTVYDYFTKWRDSGLFQQVVDALRLSSPATDAAGPTSRRPARAQPQCRLCR